MKRKNIAILALLLVSIVFFPKCVSAYTFSGWKQYSGIWYYYEYGNMKTGWIKDNGIWYYLNNDGSMAKGWKYINNIWYYFCSDGSMKTGWIKDKGKWYYMDSDGAMKHNCMINKYYLSSNGEWIEKPYDYSIEKNFYNLGENNIKIKITNNTDEFLNVYYYLNIEKNVDGKWVKLDNIENKSEVMPDVMPYDIISAKQTSYIEVNLKGLKDFNSLTKGKYRIIRQYELDYRYTDYKVDSGYFTYEFELK